MKDTITGLPGVTVTELCGVDDDGRPMVAIDGRATPARAVAPASPTGAPVDWAGRVGARVVVGLEDGDASRPIVLGLLEGETRPAATGVFTNGRHPADRTPEVLRLESARELVIRCGKAKIALSADGRVEILGGHVVSRSTGVNKLKGGAVHIN